MQSNLDLNVVLSHIAERESRLRRTNLLVSEPPASRRIVRRWIGRQLVRLGARLANEPAMSPARAR